MMNAFMMWMAGNEVHLFSIMITLMAIMNSGKALVGTGATFQALTVGLPEDCKGDVTRAKAMFLLLNLVGLGMAVMKCYYLGLLPTAASDWVDSTPQLPMEFAAGAVL